MVAVMKIGGIGLGRRVLQFRLELGGRIICEGRSDTMPAEVKIGRAADCEWRIPPTDKTASNHHARLYQRRGKWWVEDTGSRNGMYCKGERVSQWCLSAGDQLSIGDCVLAADHAEEREAERAQYHRLEQLNGADAGRMIDLDRECSIIGSAPTCDIVCDDNLVSHRHASLECRRDGSCWVKDLKSRNGTRVNRVQLKANERMLRDGDILSVAYVDFRFWDKNTTHVPTNIRWNAIVAAMTVLVCLTGWFFWNAAHPSANYLLKRALAQAEKGRFQEALELTAKARLARHHGTYEGQVADRQDSIRHWQRTAVAWEDIQGLLEARKWVSARKRYNDVKRWDWNTDTANEHKRRAEHVEKLLDTFVRMREELDSGTGTAEKLSKARENWEKALAQAEAEPAMRTAVWENVFETTEGTGDDARTVLREVAHTNSWKELKAAGEAVAAEIEAGIEAERRMRECLAPLARGDILARPAKTAKARLQALYAEDQRHKQEQAEDKKAKGYAVLRFCKLSQNFYDGVWLALDDLVAGEELVLSNLETVGALEPGWGKALVPQTSFPTHTDEAAFKAYQNTLAEANSNLCRQAVQLENTHLRAFAEMGMDEPGGTPWAIARVVERPGVLEEIYRFVDWTKDPGSWGSTTPIPDCPYDEILGCYYMHELLTAPDEEGAMDFLQKSPKQLEEDMQACPAARWARDEYEKLQRFMDFVNANPLLNGVATGPGELSGGRANRLKQYYARVLALLGERDDWLEGTVEPEFAKPELAEDRRGVAVRGLYLVLAPKFDEEVHRQANGVRGKLHRKWSKQAEDTDGLEEYLEECVPNGIFFGEWRERANARKEALEAAWP